MHIYSTHLTCLVPGNEKRYKYIPGTALPRTEVSKIVSKIIYKLHFLNEIRWIVFSHLQIALRESFRTGMT